MIKKNVTTNIFGKKFNKKIFEETGVFIIQNAIPKKIIKSIQKEWINYYESILKQNKRLVDNNNSVNFKNELSDELKYFWKNNCVKKISKQVVGKNVALYHHRILIKDKKSQDKVFLHQDYCYHVGFPFKSNLFIPLFDCGINEGTLTFYLGSHQYGYLGDAGEINPEKFVKWTKITPELKPGDVVVMNSLTWHESGPNNSDNDRVLFDTIIQPSYDPSGIELINGEWETDFWLEQRKEKDFEVDSLFISSRTKKIKNLYNNKND